PNGVCTSVMQPTGDAVPEGSQVLGIPAADVLTRTKVLRSLKLLVEIVIPQPQKRPVAVNRGFRNDPGFVYVVVLECVVGNAVNGLVAVMMATRTTRAALRYFGGKDLP